MIGLDVLGNIKEMADDPAPPKARSLRAEREALIRWSFADYTRFCGLIRIVPKSGGRVPLRLNDMQRAYVRNRSPRDQLLKGRQMGATTEEQARDIWHFLTHPSPRVTTMCQSIQDIDSPLRVLARNYNVMFEGLASLGLSLHFSRASAGVWEIPGRDAVLRIVEAGASLASAAKKGRAGTITRLHTTETAFWEFASDTLNAMVECVPAPELGTEIVHESTPNGASGKFFEDCEAARTGRNGYRFHFFPWYIERAYSTPLADGEIIVPTSDRERRLLADGVTLGQLKWYRRKVAEKGQDLVDQEYPSDPETCFLVAGRKYFDRDRLKALLASCANPIVTEKMGPTGEGLLRIWAHPQANQGYIVSADTSEGLPENWSPEAEIAGTAEKSKHDASAAVVFERGTGRHMATLWGMFRPGDFAAALATLAGRYNRGQVAVERNNHGHAVLRALAAEQHYPSIFRDRDGQPGWINHATSRSVALAQLEGDIRKGVFRTLDKAMVGQLLTFVVSKEGKPEAAKGAHDDLVLAPAIGWELLTKPERHRSETGAGW